MEAARPPTTEKFSVFHTRDVTKVYQMGEVQVHALRELMIHAAPDQVKAMVVTCGLGTGIIPVRINMPPEIASITLMAGHGLIRPMNKQ